MRIIFSLAMLTQLSNAASDTATEPFYKTERYTKKGGFHELKRESWEITPEENALFDAFLVQRSIEDAKAHELMKKFDEDLKTQPLLAQATTQRPQFVISCELLVDTCNGVNEYAKGVWFFLEREIMGRTLFLYYTTNSEGKIVVAYKHDPDFSNLQITDPKTLLIKNFEDASDAINEFFDKYSNGEIKKEGGLSWQKTKITLVYDDPRVSKDWMTTAQFQWGRPSDELDDTRGLTLDKGIQWGDESILQTKPEEPCQLFLKGNKIKRGKTKKKTYVFECHDTETRNTFYKCLKNVLAAYNQLQKHESMANESRRRLTSRPISLLKDTISNLN